MKTRLISFFVAMLVLVHAFAINLYASDLGEDVSNKKSYIVKFKTETDKNEFVNNFSSKKRIKNKNMKQPIVSVALSDWEAEQLTSDLDVEYVEPDFEMGILSWDKPNKSTNHTKNNSQIIPLGITAIGADQTLKKYDGKKVKIAVFDTGVSNHPDISIKGGASFVDYATSYDDDNGHGTHVAGTIAASNNKLGVVGVVPNAEIYAVKVLDKYGGGNYSSIIAAIEWAINNEIDIINMSFGGEYKSQALHEAIVQATNAGIIIIAAAGNNGNTANAITYPAKYSEVVSVGAIDENFRAASFSSRDSDLDIVAPGVSILSLTNDGQYATMSGTSMAAPHVTGAFAALKGNNKDATSYELINTIYETATYLGEKSTYGHGAVNLAKALGVISGSVFPTQTDEQNLKKPSDFQTESDSAELEHKFDIKLTDARLKTLKDNLTNTIQAIYENGNIELSESMNAQFEELVAQEQALRILPEELSAQVSDKNLLYDKENLFSRMLAIEEEVNEFYTSKAAEFYALEQQYISMLNQVYVEKTDVTSTSDEFQKVTIGNTANIYSTTGDATCEFTPSFTGEYNFYSLITVNRATFTYFQVYSKSGTIVTKMTEYDGFSLNFSLSLVAQETYYIRFRNTIQAFPVIAQLTINRNTSAISEGYKDVSLPEGQTMLYEFIPTQTAKYKIFTGPYAGTGAANDTYLELYSDQGLVNKILENDDYDGTLFSCISYNLEANKPYYIKLRHYRPSGFSVHARLTIERESLPPNIGETFTGSLNSASYSKTYQLTVDYSKTPDPTIALIRTSGLSGAKVTIKQQGSDTAVSTLFLTPEDGASVKAVSHKKWFTLSKPNTSETIFTYDVTIEANTYLNSTNYRINTGDKQNLESLISGFENVVTLSKYENQYFGSKKGNHYLGEYLPAKEGCFFKFLAFSPLSTLETVITIPSNHFNLRFRIYKIASDKVSLGEVIYDSDKDGSGVHKGKENYINYWLYAEKIRTSAIPKITATDYYYLEVYNKSGITDLFTGNHFLVAVGDPIIATTGGSITVRSPETITGQPRTWSPTAYMTILGGENNGAANTVPNTAFGMEVNISTASGVMFSDLSHCRIEAPNGWSITKLPIAPAKLSPSNYNSSGRVPLVGTWSVAFEAYSKTLSFKPGLYIQYYYEFGD